MAQNE